MAAFGMVKGGIPMLKRIALLSAFLSLPVAAQAEPINVAVGKTVTLNGVFGVLNNLCCGWDPLDPVAPAASVTDEVFLPASTVWQDGTVWWDATNLASASNSVEIDLGGTYDIIGFIAQGDDNDSYRIEYQNAALTWVTAWDLPIAGGFGQQTRPNVNDVSEIFLLGAPITTSRLRYTATAGDGFYSVSEIQAFVPEPSMMALLGLGVVAQAARRRRRS